MLLRQRSDSSPNAPPISSAQIIGSSTTLPGPTLNVNAPIDCAISSIAAA